MNALSKPWLVSYLIAFANTLESKTSPPDAKPKTIQIIKVWIIGCSATVGHLHGFQFLTGPTPQEPEPKSYWAEISDGEHHISSWISDDAASKFYQYVTDASDPIPSVEHLYRSRGSRLSSTQTGVFIILSYRPTLERFAPPTPGSSAEWSQRAILEIMDIELLGSERDPPFGSPKPALNHEEIQKAFTQRQRRRGLVPKIPIARTLIATAIVFYLRSSTDSVSTWVPHLCVLLFSIKPRHALTQIDFLPRNLAGMRYAFPFLVLAE
jgi:hypothetical protein